MKIQLLENETQKLQNINKGFKDESKSYLKINEVLAEGKIIDTPW